MKTQQIDLLNIGLLIFSAILSYHFPLEVFVLSFAILGPLHYLTEINWLDKKQYFTSNNKRVWLWIGIAFSIIIVFPKLYYYVNGFDESGLTAAIQFVNSWSNALIFMALVLAAGMVFLKSRTHWGILVVLGLTGAFFLNTNDTYTTFVGMFVPTIIHVYIFTLVFMLYGARKAKSRTGYIAVIIALFIPFIFTAINVDQTSYLFNDGLKAIYQDNNLSSTPVHFAKFFGFFDRDVFYVYESKELRLMMFISFIYLYHYLNWFSKTTLIQWHKTITKGNSVIILGVWIGLLGLFYYNFTLGIISSLFLGFLHIIVEFPLNLISIKGVFSKMETAAPAKPLKTSGKKTNKKKA